MVEILGSGKMNDGQKYVLISQTDWEEMKIFRGIFDWAKEQNPGGFQEFLKEALEEMEEVNPEEFKEFLEWNPYAKRYLKWAQTKIGRPNALTDEHRAFIRANDKKTGKEIYKHLVANMGYKGALKTVQNELSIAKYENQEISLW